MPNATIPEWERFELDCQADTAELRKEEAHWAAQPSTGTLQPQFGRRPAVQGRRGRASQVALFDESPLFGGDS